MEATPPYQIIKTIYEGNDGPILLIKDKNKKQFVMKKYQYNPSDYGIEAGLFIEMMILKKFKGYPNLLQLDHIQYSRGEVNIVVEKMDDEIGELILEKPSVPQIKDYMRQILKGLQTLHEHGIFHNDLKPLNIMYRRNKGKTEIKIIDFGLAHFVSYPYYRARNIKTTHHWTPPEYKSHREIGRISVNSDIYSLGIILFYFISPQDYQYLDDDPNHDNIFDPHHVDWKKIRNRVGIQGEDLLKQMLDYYPERRITSSRALQHPFLKIKTSPKQKGGATRRRRWEEPNVMISEEYFNQTNQTEFLDVVVALSENEPIEVVPKQKIPNFVWNLFYDYFEQLKIKFITMNYAMYLLNWYLSKRTVRQDQWEHVSLACLFISMKLNQYDMNSSVRIFNVDENNLILKFEEEIGKAINFAFPLPLLITKETILYREYLDIIYRQSPAAGLRIIGNIYNQYYIFNLISSLCYTDPELLIENKRELIKVVLGFHYPVDYSLEIRKKLIRLIKSRRHLPWIDNVTLEFIGLGSQSSKRRESHSRRK